MAYLQAHRFPFNAGRFPQLFSDSSSCPGAIASDITHSAGARQGPPSLEVLRGKTDVSCRNRLAFYFITLQEVWAGPAAQCTFQFPAHIEHLLYTGVHAHTSRR